MFCRERNERGKSGEVSNQRRCLWRACDTVFNLWNIDLHDSLAGCITSSLLTLQNPSHPNTPHSVAARLEFYLVFNIHETLKQIKKKKRFIGQAELHRERKQQRFSFCRFTAQMATTPGAGPGQPRSWELHPCLTQGCQGPVTWAVFCCFSRHIKQEDGLELGTHGTNMPGNFILISFDLTISLPPSLSLSLLQ